MSTIPLLCFVMGQKPHDKTPYIKYIKLCKVVCSRIHLHFLMLSKNNIIHIQFITLKCSNTYFPSKTIYKYIQIFYRRGLTQEYRQNTSSSNLIINTACYYKTKPSISCTYCIKNRFFEAFITSYRMQFT